MGFDGPGRRLFAIPVSDTRAYQQFGNAVVVPVVESVAKFMLPHVLQCMAEDRGQLRLPLPSRKDGEEVRVAAA
jgi:DNA (cytosine-5)-methyltransferase 1